MCISRIEEPEQMLKLLDKRYASNRAATRISVLTARIRRSIKALSIWGSILMTSRNYLLSSRRWGVILLSLNHTKPPLVLASLRTKSHLESTVAALRLKYTSELRWEAVTADLIQEWERQKLNKTVHSKEGAYILETKAYVRTSRKPRRSQAEE